MPGRNSSVRTRRDEAARLADADGDGQVRPEDAHFLLNLFLLGGPSPPSPAPRVAGRSGEGCGHPADPEADGLGCISFPPCSAGSGEGPAVPAGPTTAGRDASPDGAGDGETPAEPGVERHWLVSYFPISRDGEVRWVGAVALEVTERDRLLASERQARIAAEQSAERLARLQIVTGRLAEAADPAAVADVVVRYGGTMVLATCVAAKTTTEGQDFFPLTVEYRERAYAGGRIPGGYFKREGRPVEKEILTSRLIDRPIRPLFPKSFKNEVQVISLAISADQANDPDVLAMNGT